MSYIILSNGNCEKVNINYDRDRIIEYIKNELNKKLEYADTEAIINLDKLTTKEIIVPILHSFHLYRTLETQVYCDIKEKYSPILIKN